MIIFDEVTTKKGDENYNSAKNKIEKNMLISVVSQEN